MYERRIAFFNVDKRAYFRVFFMKRFAPFLSLILLITLSLIWGSSFILMKKGLAHFNGIEVGTMRMFLSFVLLLPLTFRHIGKVDKKHWKMIFLAGLTGNGLPAILFATAQTKINSSTAGVLNSLTPIFTLLIAYFFFHQQVGLKKTLGILLGLAGAIVLVLVRANGSFEVNYTYGLLVVAATACYGISVNLVKNYLHEVGSVAISSLALVIIGPLCGYYLFAHTDFLSKMSEGGPVLTSFYYILLLAALGTALSLILYNKLVKMTNAIYASMVTYLIPVVAMLWGLIDAEQIGLAQIIGILTIFAGIYLGTRKDKM